MALNSHTRPSFRPSSSPTIQAILIIYILMEGMLPSIHRIRSYSLALSGWHWAPGVISDCVFRKPLVLINFCDHHPHIVLSVLLRHCNPQFQPRVGWHHQLLSLFPLHSLWIFCKPFLPFSDPPRLLCSAPKPKPWGCLDSTGKLCLKGTHPLSAPFTSSSI